MPVTKSRNGMHGILDLDQTNTMRFLSIGDDDSATTPTEHNSYAQFSTKFPTLQSHPDHPGMVCSCPSPISRNPTDRHMQLSASSAALDLATSQSPGPDSQSDGWPAFARHRPQQHSLTMNTLQSHSGNGTPSTTMGPSSSSTESPMSARPAYRHSLDMKSFAENYQQEAISLKSPTHQIQANPPKLLSSYSANDVPTMKSTSNGNSSSTDNSKNTHAQQHFHNHNASLGRIPPNAAANNRHSRELSNGETSVNSRDIQANSYPSIQSALQASAPAFGPPMSQSQNVQSQTQTPAIAPSVNMPVSPNMPPYNGNGYYNTNYNMQMIMGMQNMQIGQQMYPPTTYGYQGGMYPQKHGGRDSQARVIQQRRQNDGQGMFPLSSGCFDLPCGREC